MERNTTVKWERRVLLKGGVTNKYMTYTETKCCEHYNGKKDITNSCVFCKTYIPRNIDKILAEFDELPIFSVPIIEGVDSVRTFVVDVQIVKDFLTTSIAQALAEERSKAWEGEAVKQAYIQGRLHALAEERERVRGNVELWFLRLHNEPEKWTVEQALSSLDNPKYSEKAEDINPIAGNYSPNR